MHKRKRAGIITMLAVVLELAYRLDLKSSALWDCGFKSRLPHQAAKNPNRLFLIGKGFGFFVFFRENNNRQDAKHHPVDSGYRKPPFGVILI